MEEQTMPSKDSKMNCILNYKLSENETLERLRLLYDGKGQECILACMNVPSREAVKYAHQHPPGYCDYPDPLERVRFWDALLRERKIINDDSIPAAYLSEFDEGLYGGLLGADIQFLRHESGLVSSMVGPFLKNWSEFENLSLEFESNKWFQRFVHQVKLFTQKAQGKFGISTPIVVDSLNFLFQLLGGTRTYIELIDNPEMVRKAIQFAFDLNVKVQNLFFDLVPLVKGGTCIASSWIPGRILDESVDPFHMTSVDYFEKWGREPVEKIFSKFDGGVLHLHGNGRHLLPAISSIKGLKVIHLGDDTGFPLAFDILDELKKVCPEKMPLSVSVKYGKFRKRLDKHRLHGGVLYNVAAVPNADEANRCMDKVRSYRV